MSCMDEATLSDGLDVDDRRDTGPAACAAAG